ncbi:MAG: SAM-dependent methyltransferase, partial [Lachnoanaerobaculum sp.]
NIAASDVEDECAGTNVDAMEAIARQTPLSALSRPKWDKEILSSLHMQVKTYANIWQRVWTRQERINNASTPMFMVESKKGVTG